MLGQLLWHCEVAAFVPDSYTGGVAVHCDFDPTVKEQPSQDAEEQDLWHRIASRVDHTHGTHEEEDKFVEIVGAVTEKKGLLRELPDDVWFDKTQRMCCPARHEFNPLGAVMC
jgi:hypothetical protein